jgi:hypothetical protein
MSLLCNWDRVNLYELDYTNYTIIIPRPARLLEKEEVWVPYKIVAIHKQIPDLLPDSENHHPSLAICLL